MRHPPRLTGFPGISSDEAGAVLPVLVPQDTLRVARPDSVISGDSTPVISTNPMMQILEATRAREQQIEQARHTDSLRRLLQVRREPVKEIVAIDSSKYLLFDSLFTESSPLRTLNKLSHTDARLQKSIQSRQDAAEEKVFLHVSDSTTGTSSAMIIKEKKAARPAALESSDWILGVLILSLVVFAWIRVFFNKYLSPTFAGLFNYQQGNRLFRENNLLYQRFSFGMNALFFMTGGLFLYFIHDYFSFNISWLTGFPGFIILSAVLLMIFALRLLICRITGYISNTMNLFAEYSHTILMINKVLGIILLPIVFALPYIPDTLVPILLFAGMGLFVLSYLFRIYKGMQIFVLNRFSIFWMILYLCALEFLPYLLVYTYIKSNVF